MSECWTHRGEGGNTTMSCHWVCRVITEGRACMDTMQPALDPRVVERDRDAHLRTQHQGATIEPHLLLVWHWPEAGEERLVWV